MSIGDNIRAARKRKDMTLEDVAKRVGVSRQTMSRYETGVINNISIEIINKIAVVLGVDPSYLLGWDGTDDVTYFSYDNIYPIQTKLIPLLGDIACGEPIVANQEYEVYAECNTDIEADFALRAKGDSMINARIYDGDIVFIRKQETVNNGEIAAVIIDDEATLKRVYFSDNAVTLAAENPAYPPIIVTKGDNKNIRILGRAVIFQSIVR